MYYIVRGIINLVVFEATASRAGRISLESFQTLHPSTDHWCTGRVAVRVRVAGSALGADHKKNSAKVHCQQVGAHTLRIAIQGVCTRPARAAGLGVVVTLLAYVTLYRTTTINCTPRSCTRPAHSML